MSCNNCQCTCPLEAGDRVRYKSMARVGMHDLRVGNAEPKFLTYISLEWAGFSIYDDKGNYLREIMIPRSRFNDTLERDTEQ
jgi:hypothetical protein